MAACAIGRRQRHQLKLLRRSYRKTFRLEIDVHRSSVSHAYKNFGSKLPAISAAVVESSQTSVHAVGGLPRAIVQGTIPITAGATLGISDLGRRVGVN
jgi:hypothetical protein